MLHLKQSIDVFYTTVMHSEWGHFAVVLIIYLLFIFIINRVHLHCSIGTLALVKALCTYLHHNY